MNSEFFGETSLLPGLNWLDLLVGHAGQADPVFWWHLQPRRGCRHPGFQDYETCSKAVRSRGCAGFSPPRLEARLGRSKVHHGDLAIGDLRLHLEVGVPTPRSCCGMPTRLRCGPSFACSLTPHALWPECSICKPRLPARRRQPPHWLFDLSRMPPTLDKLSWPWSGRS